MGLLHPPSFRWVEPGPESPHVKRLDFIFSNKICLLRRSGEGSPRHDYLTVIILFD